MLKIGLTISVFNYELTMNQ